mgnify:CR=1 FL=1
MSMKILIADDEPLARERLARLAAQLSGCKLLDEQAGNGIQALELCDRLQPDILLLDIQMPGMDGLEVAAALNQRARAPAIIFCTAHDEFALSAFEVNAVGYLVKPVRLEPLQQAIARAERLNPMQLAALRGGGEQPPARSHISAKTHKGIECIALEDILFFQAEHKYVTVYHSDGETLIDEPLKALESEFDSQLMRIHRSTLINRAAIERLERTTGGQYQLHLKGHDEPLPVSRRHVSSVRELMLRL